MNDRKEYMKKWREEHKEHIKKYKKEYAKTHDSSFKKLQQEIKKLQQKNEKLHHYKTLYQSLKKQKEELRSWLKEGFSYDTGVVDEHFIEAIENVLNKMEELEGVSNEEK